MQGLSDHDMLVQLHQAVVGGELVERVGKIETKQAGHSVWITILSGGVLAGISLAVKSLFSGDVPKHS